MGDIMNGYKLADWQCIVALDESGTGWIIARSDFIRDRDVLTECSAEDNGFNHNWDSVLSVGVYLLTLKGWSHHDSITGDIDCGLDVVKCEPLWVIQEMNYRLSAQEPA